MTGRWAGFWRDVRRDLRDAELRLLALAVVLGGLLVRQRRATRAEWWGPQADEPRASTIEAARHALEPSGTVAWRIAHSDVVTAAELLGGRLILTSYGGEMVALDPATGRRAG